MDYGSKEAFQMTETAFRCPGCDKIVDTAFYSQHVESNHKQHTINIEGVGPVTVVHGPRQPGMVDIPYLGRLRRDAFVAWTLLCILFGVLLGAGYLS